MKLVNPIHFFNSRGVSVMTAEHQAEIIDKLRAENEELKRRLKAAVYRLRALSEADQKDNGELEQH